MGHIFLLTATLIGLLPIAAADPQDALASARNLYASAAYEDALSALEEVAAPPPEAAVEIERYRALCHFALGRPEEARAALEKMIEQDPLYMPSESDVPPRVLAILQEARREMLPDLARRRYTEARDLLSRDGIAAAGPKLERVVRITSLPDLQEVEGMADLRLLAEGFLTLAKANAEKAAAANASKEPASAPQTPAAPVIYSGADTNVVPPEIIDQTLPGWTRAGTVRPFGPFVGYLRVIVDEGGNVQEATIIRSVHPGYDAVLLEAARNWRYVPARKDGKPVKFARVINVVLKGD